MEDNELGVTLDDSLDGSQRRKLLAILSKHKHRFRKKTDVGEVPREKLLHNVINTGNSRPLSVAPRRISQKENTVVNKHVQEMRKSGVIQPSDSPWSSQVVLVKKKDGSIRFCVDYRRLNQATTLDVYPLPRIDEILDSLNGASFFSTIDLYRGYWQVQVDKSDIKKTAFVTQDGLFEFKRMPFGLSNAPATFQRLMD
jgi:hypothetical protein